MPLKNTDRIQAIPALIFCNRDLLDFAHDSLVKVRCSSRFNEEQSQTKRISSNISAQSSNK